jgi:hypothetical protein
MAILTTLAIGLLVLSVILTSIGGTLDYIYSHYQVTRQHMWNDGLYLGIVAIALLLIERSLK